MCVIPPYTLHATIILLTKKSHVWLRSVRSFTLSVLVWQNNTTSYFSVSLKFGAFYITGQCGGFRIKSLIYVFIYFFGILLFFITKFVFFWYIKFPQQNSTANQKQEFVVQNCQWNCMPQHFLNWNTNLRLLRRSNFTWLKQNARLL